MCKKRSFWGFLGQKHRFLSISCTHVQLPRFSWVATKMNGFGPQKALELVDFLFKTCKRVQLPSFPLKWQKTCLTTVCDQKLTVSGPKSVTFRVHTTGCDQNEPFRGPKSFTFCTFVLVYISVACHYWSEWRWWLGLMTDVITGRSDEAVDIFSLGSNVYNYPRFHRKQKCAKIDQNRLFSAKNIDFGHFCANLVSIDLDQIVYYYLHFH